MTRFMNFVKITVQNCLSKIITGIHHFCQTWYRSLVYEHLTTKAGSPACEWDQQLGHVRRIPATSCQSAPI